MDDGATPPPNHKRHLPLREAGGDLVELLWQNGAIVAQAQAQTPHRRCSQSGAASGVTAEDATAWLIPDGGGGRDLYSHLWHGVADGDAGALVAGSGGAGTSFCGSNAVTAPALLPSPGSSAAGGQALLFKRGRDQLDSRREDELDTDDCEAVNETRPQRPAAKRRTRAAEVHNQSERRRRDRINEKMKALQELVPHCNKSDKASILDEAIEYLKSLQLQVQIMWMTTGMTPMMYPGAHQLMSPMAVGLNSACIPTAQSLSQLQKRVAPFMNNHLPDQMPQVQSPAIDSLDVANQMQNNGVCGEPRNPFLHPDDTLTAASQLPGMLPYASQKAQQNQNHQLLPSIDMPASGPCPPSFADGTGK
ncbi:transcription factor PHYTOCHROME INTERACTING FACTOR-LIKE 13-like [Hordeum vulgare subsp. vulgare]|uniref:Uncharacterized protein n=1 Tax=Hordeum vulgare subsp. vulgare TaxID=112509 RepID=M0Z576_HORVV|nr:transcription factor PHYTOCHROME INTERACTING FACTOR-LIKE 13-like [Hordeum vulgare subsp. vulgare]